MDTAGEFARQVINIRLCNDKAQIEKSTETIGEFFFGSRRHIEQKEQTKGFNYIFIE